MKKDIAKKWIKALRSGKYKQGKGYLKQFNTKKEPRHCCLGVLCELYNETMKKNHKKTLKTKDQESASGTKFVTFNSQGEGLPMVVRDWSGISSSLGSFDDNKSHYSSLADMNDFGKKFSTIANIIENNVENIV